MNSAMRRKALVTLFACVVSLQAACGGGTDGGGAGGACQQVSLGNATVRISNTGSTTFEAYLAQPVGFGAVLRPGECNLIGVQLPASYTLRTTVDITQCTYSPDSGCSSFFGPRMSENLVLSAGQTVTFAIGSGYFGPGGGQPSTYGITGTIFAVPSSVVTLTLTGASSATVTGSGAGYAFTGLPNGTYTVTPSAAGYVFTPASRQVVIQGANVSGQDFTGSLVPQTYFIAGGVSGAVYGGVLMTLGGATSRTTTTDTGGNYAFNGLSNGTYTVTPSLAGFVFTPSSRQVVVNGAAVTPVSFTATAAAPPTYSISGAVSGAATDGVLVTLGGAASRTATTAGGGLYAFTGLANGTYTVTPSLPGYTFTPPTTQVVVNGANVSATSFVAANDATLPPTIGGTPPTSATVLTAYAFTPTSTRATSFTMSGTLPPGISFSGTTGALTGSPTAAGTYAGIVITAHNQNGSADLPAFTITVSEATWDVAGQYSLANNPNGAWSYGYKLVPTGDFTLMTYILRNQDGTFWLRANGIWSPSIVAPGYFPGPQLWAGQNTSGIPAVRWTCSTPGTYRVHATFISNDGATRVLVAIVNGSTTVFSGAVQALGSTASHDGTVSLQAGDHLDFVVSWDGTSSYTPGGWTGLTGTISTVTQ